MDNVIKLVMENLKNSYAPYSNFQVSAVVELKNGKTYAGVNVENASFGLTNCAERTALFMAYSDGVRKEDIKRLAVHTKKDQFISPCGACRQVIRELMEDDAEIIFVNNKGETQSVKNKDLLPYGFTKEDL